MGIGHLSFADCRDSVSGGRCLLYESVQFSMRASHRRDVSSPRASENLFVEQSVHVPGDLSYHSQTRCNLRRCIRGQLGFIAGGLLVPSVVVREVALVALDERMADVDVLLSHRSRELEAAAHESLVAAHLRNEGRDFLEATE